MSIRELVNNGTVDIQSILIIFNTIHDNKLRNNYIWLLLVSVRLCMLVGVYVAQTQRVYGDIPA
jgi:hypothetical membrane protein